MQCSFGCGKDFSLTPVTASKVVKSIKVRRIVMFNDGRIY